jgi:integrase
MGANCLTLCLPSFDQQRLGHKKIATTLDIYAHALPSMQQDAAQRLGALLYGAMSKA